MPRKPAKQKVCQVCGKSFTYKESRGERYCSRDCYGQSQVSRLERTCKQCGTQFSVPKSCVDAGKGVFCSPQCSQESQKQPPSMVVCKCCGKVFADCKRRHPKYCSQKCYHAARPKKVAEPADERTHEHDKWRLAVILRDKKCMRCGARKNLQAHHLKGWKHYPDLRYDTNNGVALCPLCHHAQHPYLPLERFIASGGKEVQYCVVCERAFLVKKATQRVCSKKCGWERKALMGGGSQANGQQMAAMTRRPA